MSMELRRFWESKKWLAFGGGVVISILTYASNLRYGLGIETNAILGILGLSGLYILAQGKIDKNKGVGAKVKSFWNSNKAIALLVGNTIPLIVGAVNTKWDLGIDPMIIMGFIGLDAVYILRQASIDMKEPDKH